MKAVILAGGLGTRLRPLTFSAPKPLIPVAGKPVLEHIINKIEKTGIKEIIITTNYMAEKIQEFIESKEFNLSIKTIKEKKPLGTAGAVKNCEKHLKENFLVLQGDSINTINLKRFTEKMQGENGIIVKPVKNPSGYGIIQPEKNNTIKNFLEKPKTEECFSNLANTGIYCFKPEILKLIPKNKAFDFALDLFPLMIKKKIEIKYYKTTKKWVDIGKISTYIKGNKIALKNNQKIEENAIISESAEIIPPVYIGKNAIIKPNAKIGPYTVIGEKTSIGKNSVVKESIVLHSTSIGKNCFLEKCVIADSCEIFPKSKVMYNSVLGKGTIIESNVTVMPNSRLGPLIKVSKGTSVSGLLAPNLEKIERIERMLEKMPAFKTMEREQLKVISLLLEFGELPKTAVAALKITGETNLDKVLQKLQEKGFIELNQKLFSLVYDEPFKISRFIEKKKN